MNAKSRMMRAATVGSAAALTLTAVLAGPAQADPSPGAAGIGDPYFPIDGNGGIDVRHYDIGVEYDFDPAWLSGTTTLTVRATKELSRFNLDFLLPVQNVTVDGVAAMFDRSGEQDHELRISPSEPIPDGAQFEVSVDYAGDPSGIWFGGEENWLADRDEVVTMNEPHMAPWWFPANDHPRDKATFDISVTTDATKQVIGNGTRVGEPVVNGSRATTHWRTTEPMATYLAFFAAGDFTVEEGVSADGIPWTIAVSNHFSQTNRKHHLRVLRRSGKVTDWLQGWLGDYPFSSTGGVVTKLDAGFALENQTRPTYSYGIGNSIQVHELAHQWFGDSVSVAKWRHIWLNEGFATFMEALYRAQHDGMSTRTWLKRKWRWYKSERWFWRLDLTDPGPNRIFDVPVYERGAMALAALRNKIGKGDFKEVLRAWVAEHEGGKARVGQFRKLAEQVSGKDLDRFFRAWLEAPRPPQRTRGNGLR